MSPNPHSLARSCTCDGLDKKGLITRHNIPDKSRPAKSNKTVKEKTGKERKIARKKKAAKRKLAKKKKSELKRASATTDQKKVIRTPVFADDLLVRIALAQVEEQGESLNLDRLHPGTRFKQDSSPKIADNTSEYPGDGGQIVKHFFISGNYANPVALDKLVQSGFTKHELLTMKRQRPTIIMQRFFDIMPEDYRGFAQLESFTHVVCSARSEDWAKLKA
ncbi:hypothetical protein CPC08DRAFT_769758 [Agrocybe pediades]|nr:hypothetical protein CPC08DRAFT_769758 [Agrocybe pediades]